MPDPPSPIRTPGSPAAKEAGCTCPVIDNARGRGAWGTSGPGAVFWVTENCPLHGAGAKKEEKEGKRQ